jgi:hypothetical protein
MYTVSTVQAFSEQSQCYLYGELAATFGRHLEFRGPDPKEDLRMGRGGNLGEALSLSGILKVVEFILLFCATILHRHGDNGKYLFFGTSAVQMKAVSSSPFSLKKFNHKFNHLI